VDAFGHGGAQGAGAKRPIRSSLTCSARHPVPEVGLAYLEKEEAGGDAS
jgi:hypothetical protein